VNEHNSPKEGAISPALIKSIRKASGLSVSDAAALVYVHPRTWQKWEYGERHMPRGLLELFCIKGLDGQSPDL